MSDYPLAVFHFLVDSGAGAMRCSEVTGLNVEIDLIEYREGADKNYSPRKMPGMKKYANVTLKRGVCEGNNAFFVWLSGVNKDNVDRRDLTISLLNDEHEPVATWQLKNAWPLKHTAPDFKATTNEVAIETIEIAHEGLTVSMAA